MLTDAGKLVHDSKGQLNKGISSGLVDFHYKSSWTNGKHCGNVFENAVKPVDQRVSLNRSVDLELCVFYSLTISCGWFVHTEQRLRCTAPKGRSRQQRSITPAVPPATSGWRHTPLSFSSSSFHAAIITTGEHRPLLVGFYYCRQLLLYWIISYTAGSCYNFFFYL